jgi:Family of unknown function (DUF6308)
VRLKDSLDLTVRRTDGSELELRDCARLAELFFASDVSSMGPESYDAYTEITDRNRIERADIDVLNKTFRAMIMRLSEWEDLYTDEPLHWLVDLDEDWDLVTMPPEVWEEQQVAAKIEAAIMAIIGPRAAGVAQATKLLHLKRPRLVPVVDSYVAKAVGQRLKDEKPKPERAAQARMIIEHLRAEGVRLRPELEAIQGHLAVAELPVNRSRARVLDVLLWTSEDPGFKAIGQMLVRWRAEDEANDH